jgi:drug/metabolite transporter (DMT)-like permease
MSRPNHPFAFPAVLIGSSALAFGPWLVRLSGVGPVAAGFWRLALALPFLFVIAAMTGQSVHWPGRKLAVLVAFAAFFFAADLAAWHAGIHMTKLGNATLFGNVSSFAFAAWGLWLARRWPSHLQGGAQPSEQRC